jgi:hypothetical protein
LEVFVAAQVELTLRFISCRVSLCLIRRNPFRIFASENLATSPDRSKSRVDSSNVVCQSICSPLPIAGIAGCESKTL